MAKGKNRNVLDFVFGGVRMDNDDFFEDEDFAEDEFIEDEEEGEDEDGFTDDPQDRPRKRISMGLGLFGGKNQKKRQKSYEPEDEGEENEESVDDGFIDDEPEEEPPRRTTFASTGRPRPTAKSRMNTASRFGSERVTPMKNRSSSQTYSSEVRVLHPKDMEEARNIGAALLDEAVVVLNLEAMDLDVAQRIVDFTSGCVYALGADLHKVTEYFFVIAPSSVEIKGDIKNIMRPEDFAVRAEY